MASGPPGERLEISDLHLRHFGVPPGLSQSYYEVASVCLQRHHNSPCQWLVELWHSSEDTYSIEWSHPTDVMRRGYANSDDATRDGAYTMALAAADAHLKMRTFLRAETRTGCDWYLAPDDVDPRGLDLDSDGVVRLEVSGIDRDTRETLLSRASRKLHQLAAVASELDSLTGVVGFRSGTILFRRPT
jgi:hypothetical protein